MANIRKRGNYQWQCRVRKRGWPTQTKTFATRAEAEAWAATLESEMVRGVFLDRTEDERTTLSEALDRYEREVTSKEEGRCPVCLPRARLESARPGIKDARDDPGEGSCGFSGSTAQGYVAPDGQARDGVDFEALQP